ncbi:MAG: class I mannose-6-phosphate isomerase [Lachnospiraceae bacterium]|nr:class I mannose-6-phosphate isomerase [Lachnospiraceae bacterium]
MKQILFIEPVLKERIWGGTRLNEYGYDLPSDQTGECWAISAHPHGDCVVRNGLYSGKTLSSLWNDHRELFGLPDAKEFPLLIKIIDARTDLSVQVHPDDAYAAEHENGAFGKTECWYVLDCKDDATIVIGHNAKTKEEAEQLIREGRFRELIREIPVHKGDFFQIEPGVLHAIKGGTLILETQQNSDVTYRVYDYDRLENGKPRELHKEQSLAVMKCPFRPKLGKPVTYRVGAAQVDHLITCPYYSVEHITLYGSASFTAGKVFQNISIIDGQGAIDGVPVRKGDHLIIPAGYGIFELSGDLQVIRSSPCELMVK